MRHLWMTGIVLGAVCGACAPPSQTRVGLVDGARLVRVTQRGKAIRKRIQQEGDRLTVKLTVLQRKAKQLDAEVKKLAAARPPSPAALKAKRAALAEASRQLRETHLKYRQQLNAYGERLLKEFKEAVRKVVMQIRADQGLDLVIMTSRGEEQGLWIFPVVEITDEVIKRMDREQ